MARSHRQTPLKKEEDAFSNSTTCMVAISPTTAEVTLQLNQNFLHNTPKKAVTSEHDTFNKNNKKSSPETHQCLANSNKRAANVVGSRLHARNTSPPYLAAPPQNGARKWRRKYHQTHDRTCRWTLLNFRRGRGPTNISGHNSR